MNEEDQEMIEDMSEKISGKIMEIAENINSNPVKKSPMYHRAESSYEKSVIETDPFLRSKRPFVKLSGQMETFVRDIKNVVKIGIAGSQIKALQEDVDTEGGFLVPEEFQAEVVRYVAENAVVRPRARVFNMARDILNIPKVDQYNSRHGGLSLYWLEEEASKTATDVDFGRITLRAKKLIGLIHCSDELLEDSAVNLANYLVRLFAEAIAYEEDYRFLRGTGARQPLGIISNIGTGTSSINIVTRDTSTRIQIQDIISMYANHPSWADANAVWLTTKTGVGELMKIGNEGTSGYSLFMLNLRDKVVPTCMGKEIVITDKLPALGTLGDIILADLNYYYIGDRGKLAVASSIHEKFTTDQTSLRFVKRVDGQPAIHEAFTVLRA